MLYYFYLSFSPCKCVWIFSHVFLLIPFECDWTVCLTVTFWKPYRSIQVTVIRPCAKQGYASMGLPELIWTISLGNITCPNVVIESVASRLYLAVASWYTWLYLSWIIDDLCLVGIDWWIILIIVLAVVIVLVLLVIFLKKKGLCSFPVNNGKHPRGEYFHLNLSFECRPILIDFVVRVSGIMKCLCGMF